MAPHAKIKTETQITLHPPPGLLSYRCAIRDPAAGVHCSKPSAAQHRSHLVNLFEGLLFHFDCKFKKKNKVNNAKRNVLFPQQTAA